MPSSNATVTADSPKRLIERISLTRGRPLIAFSTGNAMNCSTSTGPSAGDVVSMGRWPVRGLMGRLRADDQHDVDAAMAEKRGRRLLRMPAAGLGLLGVDAATVKDVIITHMHYDHVGTFHKFTSARFHLQDAEMNFATGRHMCKDSFRHAYEVEDIVGMVRLNFKGRVEMHEGMVEVAPGIPDGLRVDVDGNIWCTAMYRLKQAEGTLASSCSS